MTDLQVLKKLYRHYNSIGCRLSGSHYPGICAAMTNIGLPISQRSRIRHFLFQFIKQIPHFKGRTSIIYWFKEYRASPRRRLIKKAIRSLKNNNLINVPDEEFIHNYPNYYRLMFS